MILCLSLTRFFSLSQVALSLMQFPLDPVVLRGNTLLQQFHGGTHQKSISLDTGCVLERERCNPRDKIIVV